MMTEKSALRIVIPANWRALIGGGQPGHLECQAATVEGALEWLTSEYPSLAVRVFSKGTKRVASWINIYLNEEDIRDLGGVSTAIESPSVLTIIQAVAGG